jgi:probable addiction module antidote protein
MPKRVTDYRQTLLQSLADPAEAAHYVNAAIEDSDDTMFLTALRDVAEAKQMSAVAKGAGIARETIYRMLSPTGNPTHRNLKGILNFLGLQLGVFPMTQQPAKQVTSQEPSTQGASPKSAKSAANASDRIKTLASLQAQNTIDPFIAYLGESTPSAAQKPAQEHFNPNGAIAIFPSPPIANQSGVTTPRMRA